MHLVIPAVLALFLLLGSTLASNASVLAADRGSSVLEMVLNESKAEAYLKIADLQNAGLTVPDSANSTYQEGLVEYQTAVSSISADFEGAKAHALKAMDLFKNTIQLIEQQQNNTPSYANQTSALVQNITDSESDAAKIKILAQANGVSTSIFANYDNAISVAKTSVANGDFQSASQQLTIAQNLLDKIYQQLENQAQASVDSRAKQFLDNAKTTLSNMIKNAKALGTSQSTIDALQSELDKLQGAKTTNEIIEATNQSSALQDTTDQYNNQRLANFEKESARIQHVIETLQGSADQKNLQLVGLAQLSQILDDIKQKIASGQTDDAASELEQEDSLLAGMNDVVNGAPAIMQDIDTARNMSNSLQTQAEAQNDDNSLNNIGQANQLLDSANSIVLNATSTDDLQSARNVLAQAQGILISVNDVLSASNQHTANQTQNSNQTTENNPTNGTNGNSTNSSDQSTTSSSSNDNSTG